MATALLTSPAGNILPASDMKQYNELGYVLVKNLVPQSHLQKYRVRFQELCVNPKRDPTLIVMRDVSQLNQEFGQQSVNKLQDFYNDPVLFDYCRLPQVVEVVKDLIGDGAIMAMHTMLINKPPDSGTKSSRHPMHQDLHYFPFRPADGVVCAWTAMEPVNRDNGCLVVLPGSHKAQLLEHGYPKWEGGVNKMYHGILDFDPEKSERLHVVMEPGDTLFFHPLLIHGSGTNSTKGFRKAISCHYANGDMCHYIDIKGTTQEHLANEVASVVTRKLGEHAQITFEDIWRLRGRPVNGRRSKL